MHQGAWIKLSWFELFLLFELPQLNLFVVVAWFVSASRLLRSNRKDRIKCPIGWKVSQGLSRVWRPSSLMLSFSFIKMLMFIVQSVFIQMCKCCPRSGLSDKRKGLRIRLGGGCWRNTKEASVTLSSPGEIFWTCLTNLHLTWKYWGGLYPALAPL